MAEQRDITLPAGRSAVMTCTYILPSRCVNTAELLPLLAVLQDLDSDAKQRNPGRYTPALMQSLVDEITFADLAHFLMVRWA